MKVGLVGFFGWGNFGDEIFYNQWMATLREYHPFRMNDLLARPYFLNSAHEKAASADAIVIGGGDLVRVESISSLYWNRAWKQKPIIISGIGVAQESGKIRSDVVPRLREFFGSEQIVSISARDQGSREWLIDNLEPRAKVRLVSDLAFGIPAPARNGQAKTKLAASPVVGFVLNKLSIEPNEIALWNKLLEARDAGLLQVRLLVLALDNQKMAEIEVLNAAQMLEVAEFFTCVESMTVAISELDLIYSAKFHGLVVAVRLGVAAVSMRETSKAEALIQQIPGAVRYVLESEDPVGASLAAMVCQRARVPEIEPFKSSAARELEFVRRAVSDIAASNDASDVHR